MTFFLFFFTQVYTRRPRQFLSEIPFETKESCVTYNTRSPTSIPVTAPAGLIIIDKNNWILSVHYVFIVIIYLFSHFYLFRPLRKMPHGGKEPRWYFFFFFQNFLNDGARRSCTTEVLGHRPIGRSHATPCSPPNPISITSTHEAPGKRRILALRAKPLAGAPVSCHKLFY